jgi:hypothetical protein
MGVRADKKKAQAIRDAWAIGDLRYKLHAGQRVIDRAWRKRSKKLFVVNCARRFGKTYYWVVKQIENMLKCPLDNPQFHFGTDTEKHVLEFVIPILKKVLEDCPAEIMPDFDSCYLKSERLLSIRNIHGGISTLRFFGLDRTPDSTRGNYSDGWVVDEAGFVDDLPYIVSSIINPQLQTRPGGYCVLSSTPSRTPAHPFRDFCDKAAADSNFVKLTIKDNPLIDAKERKRIRDEDCFNETDWLREYMCEFVTDETLAICPEIESRHVTNFERPAYFEYLHRYESMDLGVKVDLTALLFGFYDPMQNNHRGKLYIEDEWDCRGPQMTTELIRDMVIEKESTLWTGLPAPYLRIADNDNPLLIQDLMHLHNLHFLQVQKDGLVHMINKLRQMFKNNEIEIHERCKKTIGSLKYGVWNKTRTSFDRTNFYGHFDHVAALIYMVQMLNRVNNPIPAGFIAIGPDWVKSKRFKDDKVNKQLIANVKKLFNRK